MSIQFSQNETVVRKFDYATLGYRKKSDSYAVARSLIVTNKRVIHQDVCEQFGKDLIVRREMPIEHAKFVDIRLARSSKVALLIWGIVLAVLAAVAYLGTVLRGTLELLAKVPELVFLGIAAGLGVVALALIIGYFGSRRMMLSCTVSTDGVIHPVIANTVADESANPKKVYRAAKQMQLDIRIDKRVAKEMADGLGAAILDAMELNHRAENDTEAAVAVNSTVENLFSNAEALVSFEEEEPVAEVETVETEDAVEAVETVEEDVEEPEFVDENAEAEDTAQAKACDDETV